jgi:hypothetical protein
MDAPSPNHAADHCFRRVPGSVPEVFGAQNTLRLPAMMGARTPGTEAVCHQHGGNSEFEVVDERFSPGDLSPAGGITVP